MGDPIAKLRIVLESMSDQQLEAIGVTLQRDDHSWEWLRDIFVETLRQQGRLRAAKGLAELGDGQYSLGLSKPFLRQLAAQIRMHFEPTATTTQGESE